MHHFRLSIPLLCLAGLIGCDRSDNAPSSQPTPTATGPAAFAEPCDLPETMPDIAVPGDRAAAEDLAAAANARGAALMLAGKSVDALQEFRKVRILVPDRIEGFVNEAIVYAHKSSPGCTARAVDQFQRILEREPQQPHALYGLALLSDGPDTFQQMYDYARRFAEARPADPFGQYVLGKACKYLDRNEEALAAFKRAIELDPDFIPGYQNYGHQLRLLNPADQDAAAEAMKYIQRVSDLNDRGKSMRFWGNAYSEHGAFAQAMPLFGLGSTARIAESAAPVTFADVTAEAGLPESAAADRSPLGVAWLDADGDGLLDLFVCGGGALGSNHLYRNVSDRPGRIAFADVTEPMNLGSIPGATAAVAADYNRDGHTDLILTGPNGTTPLIGDGRHFSPVTAVADKLPPATGQPSLEDIDHDGDEDLFLTGTLQRDTAGANPHQDPANRVFRNRASHHAWDRPAGDEAPESAANFTDASADWPIGTDLPPASGALFSDVDGDTDTDAILFGSFDRGVAVYENRRENGWAPLPQALAADVPARPAIGATLADLDNNGQLDLLLTHDTPPVLTVLLERDGRFTPDEALQRVLPENWRSATGAAALDADNDGDLDILALVAADNGDQPRLALLTNDGTGRFTHDPAAGAWPLPLPGQVIAPADVDGDGRLDLAIRTADGSVRLYRNTTDNGFDGLALHLRRSPDTDAIWKFSCPVGAKVRLQTGRYAQLRRSATAGGYFAQGSPYVHFGLGDRLRKHPEAPVDGLEIFWTSGAIQGLTALPPAEHGAIPITEIDVRPASCPFLFAWDGVRYRFMGDVMAASPPGLYIAPGVYASCDTDEYIRMPEGLLAPRDGAYDLVVHECLREVGYLDKAALLAIDHPSGVVVYPNERFSGPPPFPEYRLFAMDTLLAPRQAIDHHAENVLPALLEQDDGLTVNRFRHLDIPGFGEPHAVELTFDAPPAGRDAVLLLHGYLKFPGSPAQYVAHERGLRFEMPRLDIRTPEGDWQPLIANIGAPAGFPRTMTVDLTGKLPPGEPHLRITTNILVYWDWMRLGLIDPAATPVVHTLAPDRAELSRVGFPRMTPPQRLGEPETYDYGQRVDADQPIDAGLTYRWPNMTGPYTRFGDVTPLMGDVDDRYAIFAAGEQVRLRFDAARLPPPASGHQRTFLLFLDGWVKDNYHQTATAQTVGPLPFHRMNDYPRPAGLQFPWTDATRAWDAEYNTRFILNPGAF